MPTLIEALSSVRPAVDVQAIDGIERIFTAMVNANHSYTTKVRLVEHGWTSPDGTERDWRFWQRRFRVPPERGYGARSLAESLRSIFQASAHPPAERGPAADKQPCRLATHGGKIQGGNLNALFLES